jgi:hypothetical protein
VSADCHLDLAAREHRRGMFGRWAANRTQTAGINRSKQARGQTSWPVALPRDDSRLDHSQALCEPRLPLARQPLRPLQIDRQHAAASSGGQEIHTAQACWQRAMLRPKCTKVAAKAPVATAQETSTDTTSWPTPVGPAAQVTMTLHENSLPPNLHHRHVSPSHVHPACTPAMHPPKPTFAAALARVRPC